MSTHSPEHPYECLRCAKRFKRDDWRKTHERSCTKTPSLLTTFVPIKNADGAYNCPICEKVLKTSRILKQHIKIHTEPPPLVCDVYGKGFNRMLHLARHSNVHKRDRPFKQRNKASRINLSSSTAETNDLRHLGDLGLDCASKRSVSGKLSDQAGPLLYRPDAGLLDGHFSDIDHCTSFGDSCHPTTSVAHSEEAGGSENECHFPREDNYHFRNALDDVPASETYICLQPNPVTNLAEVCASPTNSDQDQFSILIDPILATL
ncbi:hypothetical protein CGMCC3_g17167 [Colletotrichum fructicola]|uniref:Zinc finger protein 681 n=1 Tax=Colletotrichum fructicola (strain Nara gc5) TaxID=1213859 RepID=A0A7J6IDI1_COLFN|nr:uncharacterized protein CGMCC3_g17167 [Colletotrichum fructicola]KAE9566655.1 hypothetical protein CGMCC3_g17167 [Colletotrichum fructicola]KAF4473874.1 Zinc finger protein 681 [Colletotrichum fructicola Nara gc5]